MSRHRNKTDLELIEKVMFAIMDGLKECRGNNKIRFMGDQSSLILKRVLEALKDRNVIVEIPAEVRRLWEKIQ
jgi:hypothetical protein